MFSRFVVAVAGVIMILAGLCPKVSAVASIIPTPVFGGAVIMMFGVILVSGIKIIGNSKPDDRMQMIVAVSLAIGLGFNAVPTALGQLPLAVSMLLCGIPGTAISAVILNLVIPGRRKSTQLSDGESDASERDEDANERKSESEDESDPTANVASASPKPNAQAPVDLIESSKEPA